MPLGKLVEEVRKLLMQERKKGSSWPSEHWGTVLAVSGVGLLVLSVKTALGVKDVRIVLQLFSKNLGSLTPYESKT